VEDVTRGDRRPLEAMDEGSMDVGRPIEVGIHVQLGAGYFVQSSSVAAIAREDLCEDADAVVGPRRQELRKGASQEIAGEYKESKTRRESLEEGERGG
jgi:hypothetical protein